jgi:hypothetical protein
VSPDETLLLVADASNCRVAVLRATDGTWVHQLTGLVGALCCPFAVAVVPSTGNVLVSDIVLNVVVCFSSTDNDSIIAVLGGNELSYPCAMAVLDGPNCPGSVFRLHICIAIYLCGFECSICVFVVVCLAGRRDCSRDRFRQTPHVLVAFARK